MATTKRNKSKKQSTPEETAAKHRDYVQSRLPKLRHSPEPLFKALIAALDAARAKKTLAITSDAEADTRDALQSLLELYTQCSDFQKIIATEATLNTFLQSLANDAFAQNYDQAMLDMILSVLKPFIPNLSREYKAAYQLIKSDSTLRAKAKPFVNYLHAPQTGTKVASNSGGSPNGKDKPPLEKLQYAACKLMDDLREASSEWAFSLHWAYTIANPAIDDPSNFKYSPLYQLHACPLPKAVNGEFDYKDVDGKKLVRHGDKIVGDDRFAKAGIAEFGTAWDADGNVVKHDATGGPIRDGWFGSICAKIDGQQVAAMKKLRRGRHFAAFLIAHTRDEFVPTYGVDVLSKPRHLHGAMKLPREVTRLRFMQAMGVNFDDYVAVFKWIAKTADQKLERTDAFIATLQGVMKNYEIPDDFMAKLQYLVHESYGAIKDDKIPYLTSEVVSWLPDAKYTTYSEYAGVYDNQPVASGLNDEIIRNLHSAANVDNDTSRFVGLDAKHNALTYEMCRDFRTIGRKGRGKRGFTEDSKLDMMNTIMTWVRQGELMLMDYENLIHASFDDADADALLADPKFSMALETRIERYLDSKRDNPNFQRDMLTIAVTGITGGLGKTRLSKAIGAARDRGHEPVQADPWEPDKTYDPLEKIKYQPGVIIDEIKTKFFSWPGLKSLLDPSSKSGVASRYQNAEGMLLHHMFLTQVLPGGIATYIRHTLKFAKGISDEDYMAQDEDDGKKNKWHLVVNDVDAGYAYLGALSQLMRRLPVWVELWPTDSGGGTNIKVSVINFDPHGQNTANYDYVHTADSVTRVNTVISKSTPDTEVARVAKKVSSMIDTIQAKAQSVFDADPNASLNDVDGFIADDCDFGYRLTDDGEPYITDDLNTPLHTTAGSKSLTLDDAKVKIRQGLHADFVMLGFDAAVDGQGVPKRFDLKEYSEHRDDLRDKYLYLFSSTDAFDSFIDDYRKVMIESFVLLPVDMTSIAPWRHNEVDRYGRVDKSKASAD